MIRRVYTRTATRSRAGQRPRWVRATASLCSAFLLALVLLSALPAVAFAADIFDSLGETGQQLRGTYEAMSSMLSPFHGEMGSIQAGAPDLSGEQIYGGFNRVIYAKRIEGDPKDLAASYSKEPRMWVVVVVSNEKWAGLVPYVFDVPTYYDPERGIDKPTIVAQVLDPWWMMQLWRSGGEPGYDAGKDPWRVAVGGAAALAAAAAAIAAAAASGAQRSGKKLDPKSPVGWVLNLSSNSLVVSEKQPAGLQAAVYRVTADGGTMAVPATFALGLPAGISANPAGGSGTLSTSIWQSGPAGAASNLMVSATTEGGTYSAGVTIHTAAETLLKLEPEARNLSAIGGKPVRVSTHLVLSESDRQDPVIGFADALASIEFRASDPWLDISAPLATTDGKDVNVALGNPEPGSNKQPPATVTLSAFAQVGGKPVTNSVVFDVARKPTLEVRPDAITLAAKSGDSKQVTAWVVNPGVGQWKFETRWESDERPARQEIRPDTTDRATLTLTESAADGATRTSTGKLIVVASHPELPEPLEREVLVSAVRQGIFIDTIGQAPDGTYHLDAQTAEKPKDVWVRVYVKGADGEIKADAGLARQVRISWQEEGKTVGRNAADVGGLEFHAVPESPPNEPGATWRFQLARRIPADQPMIPLRFEASVPGQSEPEFTTQFTIGLIPEQDGPGSPGAELEYQRAMQVIDKYVPAQYQDKLRQIVNSKKDFLGAEGMTKLRKWVWKQAVNLTLAEGDRGYEDVDKWATRITTVLDFSTWAGDQCFSALALIYGGPYAGLAADVGKGMLISAIQAWELGQSPDDWVKGQYHMVPGMVEGMAVNPDFFQALGMRGRAMAWSVFVSYHFFKRIAYEKKPMLTAIKETAMAAGDAAIASFLFHHAHIAAKGVAPHGAGADEHAPGEKPVAGEKSGGGEKPAGAGEKSGTAEKPTAAEKPSAGDTSGTPPKPAAGDKPGAGHGPADAPSGVGAHAGAESAGAPKPAGAEPAAGREPGPLGSEPTAAAGGHEPVPTGHDVPVPPVGHEPNEPAGPSEPTKPAGPKDAPKPTEPPKPKDPPKPKPKPKDPPPPPPPAPTPPLRPEGPRTWQEARGLINANTKTVNGRKVVDPKVVENVMRNPDAMRALKGEDPGLWKTFTDARQQVYDAHDGQLKSWIEANVPEAKGHNVKIETFGTKTGVDRDFRAGVEIIDPSTGEKKFIEIPKEHWQDQSNKIFSAKTGGPGDSAGAAKWAKDHQQLQTDQHHGEASVDMSDQGYVQDPATGEWRKTQFTRIDEHGNVVGDSNLDMTKRGESTLLDPDGVGRTYETKVAEAYHADHPADAYAQANKAVHSLEGVREGYAKQHYGVKELPPKVQAGMDAIKQVADGTMTPAQAEAKLKEMKYADLPDFMEKISGQFGAFKGARKP
jgi:hypothetical protein